MPSGWNTKSFVCIISFNCSTMTLGTDTTILHLTENKSELREVKSLAPSGTLVKWQVGLRPRSVWLSNLCNILEQNEDMHPPTTPAAISCVGSTQAQPPLGICSSLVAWEQEVVTLLLGNEKESECVVSSGFWTVPEPSPRPPLQLKPNSVLY